MRGYTVPSMDVFSSLASLVSDYPTISAAWIFGSVARDEARQESDLDMALLLADSAATAVEHARALADLAARCEQTSGRSTDLIVLGLHDPILAHRVLSEGRLIYESDRARRLDFESKTISRFVNWYPTYRWVAEESLRVNRRWAGAGR